MKKKTSYYSKTTKILFVCICVLILLIQSLLLMSFFNTLFPIGCKVLYVPETIILTVCGLRIFFEKK